MGTTIVSAVCNAISSIFNWSTNRSTLKNTAEMQAAQKAKDELAANDKTNTAIKNKDVEEIQKEIGE